MADYNGAYVNGIRIVGEPLTKEQYDELTALAAKYRPDAEALFPTLDKTCHYKSYRWKDDKHIGWRASGHIPPEAFAAPNREEILRNYILAAYIDAAGADWWYTFEKDWGSDD